MLTYFGKETVSGKYYNFKIFLNTPYKWGDGYSNASYEERKSNDEALVKCMEHIKFNLDFIDRDGGCDSYYNGFEEIYVHPMELSGCCKIETIEELEKFIKESNFKYTKFAETRVFKEAINYSFEEIFELAKRLTSGADFVMLKMTHPYGLPLNYDFDDFDDIHFKEYSFVGVGECRSGELKKEFLIGLLNDIIRKEE